MTKNYNEYNITNNNQVNRKVIFIFKYVYYNYCFITIVVCRCRVIFFVALIYYGHSPWSPDESLIFIYFYSALIFGRLAFVDFLLQFAQWYLYHFDKWSPCVARAF